MDKFAAKIFKDKKLSKQNAKKCGYKTSANFFCAEKRILNGQLLVKVSFSDSEIRSELLDCETHLPYTLLFVDDAQGAFVGKVREEYQAFLEQICKDCYENDVFKHQKTQAIVLHLYQKYGESLEFLWEKFSNNAIIRRQDNKKWYAAFMVVPKNKITGKSNQPAEILVLRAKDPEVLFDQKHFFPAYHMNKKNWLTVLIDDELNETSIFPLLDESRKIAGKK